eukprot:5675854-Alexandrium_andersonii.AAC.1
MSASLVGSEMCIRDSGLPVGHFFGDVGGASRVPFTAGSGLPAAASSTCRSTFLPCRAPRNGLGLAR